MSARIYKSVALIFTISCASLVPTHVAAKTCARSGLPVTTSSIVPIRNPDQSLFNRAILSEVNYERCQVGLSPLRLAGGLITVAGNHAA
jgi:uncharacterized protein YkwD